MKISAFKTDEKKETDGVWIECGEGLELKLARMNNPKMVKRLRVLTKNARGGARKLSDEAMEPILKQVVSETVLLGWKNLEDDNGVAVEYSNETALKYLTEMRDFYLMVIEMANDPNYFKHEEIVEASEGNS